MKALGFTRKLDELGRFVIPIETRKRFGINENDRMEMFVEDENIILKKWTRSCVFCHGKVDLRKYKGKIVCESCRDELKSNNDWLQKAPGR